MSLIKLSKYLIFCALPALFFSQSVFSDTIYQWTDPWGQIKYSKTQVSGSMVSELTELPKIQESTEQQKQEAMLNKLQKIENANTLYRQKKSEAKFLKQQDKNNENHCRKLRNLLADIRLRSTRIYYRDRYYFSGNYYSRRGPYFRDRFNHYPDYSYDLLENDLYWEIRQNCR